ncbi:unnamed protein product [Blepharisma stoltei]|uniref:Uncharacterized protein n=1 Tax=Blepharisma stoltei TaxID=1481888 RepID=A0AAU9I708_9CILI|nr:unnamed protein product [Blepharisma stoltei]
MNTIKAVILGIPSRQLETVFAFISSADYGVLSKEDSNKMQKILKNYKMLRFASLPISLWAGYFIPIPVDLTHPCFQE